MSIFLGVYQSRRSVAIAAFVLLFGLASSGHARADDIAVSSNGSTDSSPPDRLTGFMVGAGVADVLGTVGIAGSAGYWGEYVGVTFEVGVQHVTLETDEFGANDFKFRDSTLVDIGVSGRVGKQYGLVKPYVGVGFGYSFVGNDITEIDTSLFQISPGIGIDFLASKHLVFSLNVISIPIIVGGKSDEEGFSTVDFDGVGVSFLKSFGISYLF